MDHAIVKSTTEATKATAKVVESSIRKAWSVLDAAAEKRAPSEVLSKQAISAIQGKGGGG